MKKELIILWILIVLLATLTLLYSQFNLSRDSVIRIGYNMESFNSGPIMIAYEADLFDKHNLKVELVLLKSGREVQQALATGRIDMGSAGATNFFIPISKGAPIKIIAPSTVSPTRIFVRPDGKVKTFNDLVGKSIASRKGESSNLALGYALKKEGISFNAMEFIDIDKNIRPIALIRNKIVDAVVVGKYEEKIYLDYGAIPLEEWDTKGYVNKSFPRTVIAVNSNFMNKHKDSIDSFIDAFIESQKFIKDNPDEAAGILAKHLEQGSDGAIKFSTENIKDSWRDLKYILWNDPDDFLEISKIEKEIGDLDSDLILDQIFDLSFEEKLKNAQNEIYETAN
ncbi:MAG: ABC transporter substrate-binding protein [Nanoarchaeota archaeon]